MLETITSGSYKSTAYPVMINTSAPRASQDRIIVPKLPLFEGLSIIQQMDSRIIEFGPNDFHVFQLSQLIQKNHFFT